MEIRSFPKLPSTQRYLLDALKSGEAKAPVAVITREQYAGVGSRDNGWEGAKGNFFVSIALKLSELPDDLPLSSASIYFSFLMKKVLEKVDENVWLKWPNDLYLGENKIGGIITKAVDDTLVCGMGINLKKTESGYGALDTDISPETLLKNYLKVLEKFPDWKQVFSEYRVEFEQSRKFTAHVGNVRKSLENAHLCDDGSLLIEGKKVYSTR